MSETKARIKAVIMDKAPAADNVMMNTHLGFNSTNLTTLANALNQEFQISINAGNLTGLQNVGQVCTYVENIINT